MKNYARILSQIYNQPWTITEEGLQTIIEIAERRGDVKSFMSKRDEIDAIMVRRGDPLEGARRVSVIASPGAGSVAIVPISGIIFRKANLFTEISGATSIETMALDFNVALEDTNIKAIVLDIDSPGGQVSGTNEMSDIIFNAREKKPVIAYIGGSGTSGAYWLASAASEVVIDPTAVLGSIGVVIGFSKKDPDDKIIEFVSTASPNKRPDPETDKGRAEILKTADALADVFIAVVARNRGVDEQVVRKDFGRGGLLVGKAAVDVGMADRFGSLEDVISAAGKKYSTSIGAVAGAGVGAGMKTSSGGQPVDPAAGLGNGSKKLKGDKVNMEITVDSIGKEHPKIAESFKAMGREEGLTQGRKEGAETELARIKAVQKLSIAGHEELINTLAYDGKTSPGAAALQIMEVESKKREKVAADLKSDADDIPPINPTVSDGGDSGDAKQAAQVKGIVAGAQR